MLKKIITLLALFITLSMNCMATIIFVDSAHIAGIQNGTSWSTAFSNFQDGIDAAQQGDSVWVAKGTYKPPFNQFFTMKAGVKILGGFTNTNNNINQRNWQTNLCILKGNNNTVVENDTNNLTNTALLDGFTVSDGLVWDGDGGGICNYNVSPTIENCTFSNNQVFSPTAYDGNGGGIYNFNSSPNISNCFFTNNITTHFGGGIYNDIHSSPVISDCNFVNCRSSEGGAIAICGSNQIISNCSFSSDTSSAIGGGAIVCLGQGTNGVLSNVTLNNCSFTGNNGGAISSWANTILTINNSVFSANTSPISGGAINSNAYLAIHNCHFIGNSAPLGGAIYSLSGANITNSIFNENIANDGGAINISEYSISVTHCIFSDNLANASGGGIYFNSINNGQFDSCSFIRNSAFSGGGMYYIGTGQMHHCNFEGNKATGGGGGLCIRDGDNYITDCNFISDTASYGGAICNSNMVSYLTNVLVANNRANNLGGGIYNEASIDNIINCTIVNNDAPTGAGAIYNAYMSSNLISNSILWNNDSGGIDSDGTTSASITSAYKYSLLQGFAVNSNNHLMDGNTDPQFNNIANGNYQLRFNSPCINQGANSSIPSGTLTDLVGSARINDSIVDMGAYEYRFMVNIGNDTALCNGDTLMLDAGNFGSTFLWNTGDTTQSIKVSAGGNYNVSVTNTNGTLFDSIQVGINTLPVLNLGNDTAICSGSIFILNAQNPGSVYQWSNDSTTQTIQISTAGTYSLSVSDSNGCKSYDTIQIAMLASPIVNLGNDINSTIGDTITLNAGNPGCNYLWNTNDTTQSISLTTGGTYIVTVTNSVGCTAGDSINISFNATGIVEANNINNQWSISPNPAKNFIVIHINNMALLNAPVILISISGEVVKTFSIKNKDQIISTSNFPSGIYTLKIGNIKGHKLVIE